MAFVGEDDQSFSACLAQFLRASEAVFERRQASLTSMLAEIRELRAESRQTFRAWEEGVLQDFGKFREAIGKKDEILPASPQGGIVSPIPDSENIHSETEIPKHPLLANRVWKPGGASCERDLGVEMFCCLAEFGVGLKLNFWYTIGDIRILTLGNHTSCKKKWWIKEFAWFQKLQERKCFLESLCPVELSDPLLTILGKEEGYNISVSRLLVASQEWNLVMGIVEGIGGPNESEINLAAIGSENINDDEVESGLGDFVHATGFKEVSLSAAHFQFLSKPQPATGQREVWHICQNNKSHGKLLQLPQRLEEGYTVSSFDLVAILQAILGLIIQDLVNSQSSKGNGVFRLVLLTPNEDGLIHHNWQVHFMEGNKFMPTLMMMLFFKEIIDELVTALGDKNKNVHHSLYGIFRAELSLVCVLLFGASAQSTESSKSSNDSDVTRIKDGYIRDKGGLIKQRSRELFIILDFGQQQEKSKQNETDYDSEVTKGGVLNRVWDPGRINFRIFSFPADVTVAILAPWDPGGGFLVEVEVHWKCSSLCCSITNLVVKVFSNRGDLIRFI